MMHLSKISGAFYNRKGQRVSEIALESGAEEAGKSLSFLDRKL
jgi:hypothetical protein